MKSDDLSLDLDLDDIRKRAQSLRRHHTYTPTHMVSTVDLFIEQFGGMWAETMVFPLDPEKRRPSDWGEEECERYSSFELAMADHPFIVKRYGGEVKVVHSVGGKVVKAGE